MAGKGKSVTDAPVRYAACDVGSNAVRLAIARVYEGPEPFLRREAAYRVPLRLGHDVFTTGKISKQSAHDLVEIFQAFSHLLAFFRPTAIRACATSAMREASNGTDVATMVQKASGVPLEILSGADEASVIFAMHAEESLEPLRDYLYIDVGGGSTELTLLRNGAHLRSESFRLGGVRLLEGSAQASEWERMRSWIEDLPHGFKSTIAIGTGGNIGKIHDLGVRTPNEPISRRRIREVLEELESLDVEERVRTHGLKPDRADVIVPAGKVYHQVMKWANIKTMMVPRAGLVDGLLEVLFEANHGGLHSK
jgi:exopolyphosphatase/guanosine-5'-triphosphate,3'-diphosphate pyrophosphatase